MAVGRLSNFRDGLNAYEAEREGPSAMVVLPAQHLITYSMVGCFPTSAEVERQASVHAF